MSKFLFITDFDGTVTAQDFFVQIAHRYKPEKLFLNSNQRGFAMLSDVFSNLNLTEDELLDEIKHVAVDFNFFDFCKFVKKTGGEVLVLSAGARYYVENRLRMEKLSDVKIIANESFYFSGGIKLVRNECDPFYDKTFGINKLKIVQYYRNKFDILAYAGDSYVDFDACRLCDFKFAKKKLATILDLFYIDYYKFLNFAEIKNILEQKIK